MNFLSRLRGQRALRIAITEIGNLSSGDQAMLIAAARHLHEMGSRVTLLSRVDHRPAFQRAGIAVDYVPVPLPYRFEGIDTLEGLAETCREQEPALYRKIIASLDAHDILALAPGCRFVDGYHIGRSVLTAALSLERGRPLIALQQSIGPLDDALNRSLVAQVLSRCELVLVRDSRSMQFCSDLRIPSDRYKLGGEIVLGEDYPQGDIEFDLGVNVRYGFNGHVSLPALGDFLDEYRRSRPNARVLVYSTTFNLSPKVTEVARSRGSQTRTRVVQYPDYGRAAGACAVNVSDSFHGVLFSIKARRPVVCCQPDWRTWKLEGMHAPAQPPLRVLPGLADAAGAREVLDQVAALERDPSDWMSYAERFEQYGRRLAGAGWSILETKLQEYRR